MIDFALSGGWSELIFGLLSGLGIFAGALLRHDDKPEDPDSRDRRLVMQARRGDRGAFDELIHRYQGRIFAFCYRMIPSVEEAEEVTQDVFVQLHANLGRFRGDSKFSTWLYQIAKNISLNKIKALRRRKAHRHQSLDQGPAEGGEPSSGSGQPLQIEDQAKNAFEEIEDFELRELVNAKIQQLRVEHRLPLILRDIEGMSYDAIAKVMKLAEGTVKSRIHRARLELKESLDGHF